MQISIKDFTRARLPSRTKKEKELLTSMGEQNVHSEYTNNEPGEKSIYRAWLTILFILIETVFS